MADFGRHSIEVSNIGESPGDTGTFRLSNTVLDGGNSEWSRGMLVIGWVCVCARARAPPPRGNCVLHVPASVLLPTLHSAATIVLSFYPGACPLFSPSPFACLPDDVDSSRTHTGGAPAIPVRRSHMEVTNHNPVFRDSFASDDLDTIKVT